MNATIGVPSGSMFSMDPPACGLMDILKELSAMNGEPFSIQCDYKYTRPWTLRFKIRTWHTVTARNFGELMERVMQIIFRHNRTIELENAWKPEGEYSI